MPGAFLLTAAPNGLSWEHYCRPARPVTDVHGFVTGPWGECLHWAVMFEKDNPNWQQMPGYEDGPAGQVIAFLEECGHGFLKWALERNEQVTNEKMERGDRSFAFQEAGSHGNAPSPPPVQVGQQFALGEVHQGQTVPHHLGAPGSTPVVVGVPIHQRAQQAIASGRLPGKTNVSQVKSGAQILDENQPFPDKRPCRDAAFAVLFVLVVVAMVVLLIFFAGEIPKMVIRAATQYESFPGAVCGMQEIQTWGNGESTYVSGITQRLQEPNSTRRLSGRSDDPAVPWATTGPNSATVLELPGLSDYVHRLEVWAALVGMEVHTGDTVALSKERRLYASSRRRRSVPTTSQNLPLDTDCERACAAFNECAGFNVLQVSSSQSACVYQKAPSGGMPEPQPGATCPNGLYQPCAACWRKLDGTSVDSMAAGILGRLFGLTVAGACLSMITACVFVMVAASQPFAATYCGVYFVPGVMIILGIAVFAVMMPYATVIAPALGVTLILFGALMCLCTHVCYRSLIPLTIEVIAVVSAVTLKHMSMLLIAACSAVLSVLWGFICAGVFVGVFAAQDRASATTPAAQKVPVNQSVFYLQYFGEMLVYFWAVFVFFNTSHVTFCGVFGRWYYGKEGPHTVASSFKVATLSSFGSVCLGALIVSVVRALQAVARKARDDSEDSGNYLTCAVACVLQCFLACLGDILEWISLYAFVQVAVRGMGFLSSAKATYSLASISNLTYVVAAILCEWVAFMGAVLCGLTGAIFTGLIGYFACDVPGLCVSFGLIGAFFGCLAGFTAGGSAVGVINSGTNSILMSWAERPDVLQQTHPHLHDRFEAVLQSKLTR